MKKVVRKLVAQLVRALGAVQLESKALTGIVVLMLVFSPFFTYAESTGVQVNLDVSGCNNNGICETGENALSCPVDCAVVTPPPTSGGGGSSGYMPKSDDLYIYNISIQPNFNNAFIYWSSSVSTISTVKWGTTTEVKDGSLKSVVYALNHKAELINLKPGTLYYFTIESQDVKGRTSTYPPVYFFTKFFKDTAFPLNPLSVSAVSDIQGITLSWKNPPDENFSYIRIMRHEDRFRGDPFLGRLVYEGRDQKFLDKEVVPGKKYFYTVFSRDKNGKFSTGVGVSATAFSPIEIPPVIPPVVPPEVVETPPVVAISETFFVHQYNQQVEPLTNLQAVPIESDKSTIIDINTKTQPDDLVKVTDENGNIIGQYLFSFNADSGRFQSVLPPPEKEGIYDVKIYRYKDNVPTIISEGLLQVTEKKAPKVVESHYNILASDFLFVILLFFMLILLAFLLKRRRKAQQK